MLGQVSPMFPGSTDPIAVRKQVIFRPSDSTDTVKVGQLVAYNSDLAADYKERTSNPATDGTTYAEGAQTYNARMFIAEKPAAANLHATVGIVAALGSKNGADGDNLEVYLLNGATIPVYTDANCTLDSTVLGVEDDSYTASVVTGDGSPLPIGIAAETVDRSETNGLVWVRTFSQIGIGIQGAYFAPIRALTTGDAYGLRIDISNLLTGAGATGPRSWGVGITGSKTSGVLTTAGCDDAGLRIDVRNYVENESIYNFRGLNVCAANRDGGTVGELDNIISVSLKQGSTTATGIGLKVDAEDLSENAKTEFGGLDVALCREGLAATTEYGIQIRTRGTINSAIDAALRVDKQATDYGFSNLISLDAAASVGGSACTGHTDHDASDIAIPIKIGSSTYYIIAQDSKG